ncbi:nucleotide pyrophosphohydrolase [Paenibacillus wynnii]|uniref:Nucleotide pyrophosphohydrolase n=1 Tax=Paenibacillus wynnii TaxID=268407 RepID=A0A098M4V9_9BACL|nr:nucleotide pyrophosphohydrolase [Paenibacillus wynnii]KGE17585.1 nucleotide pyrophosphohydrolase [Paenibacillus wynnii]
MNELIEKILEFRQERDWEQFHNPKDLAISLNLEASELLELFQWKTSEEALENNIDKIRDELADIFYYILLISNDLGIDLEDALRNKMIVNEEKYPVDKAYGSNKKYTEL